METDGETEMETEEPLRGDALLVAVWNQIFEHPETHDQRLLYDESTHGSLGWVQILGGRQADPLRAERDAEELASLTCDEINEVSSPTNNPQRTVHVSAGYPHGRRQAPPVAAGASE